MDTRYYPHIDYMKKNRLLVHNEREPIPNFMHDEFDKNPILRHIHYVVIPKIYYDLHFELVAMLNSKKEEFYKKNKPKNNGRRKI